MHSSRLANYLILIFCIFFIQKFIIFLGAQKNCLIAKFFQYVQYGHGLEAVYLGLVVFAYTYLEIYSGEDAINFVKYFYMHLIFLCELYISNITDPGQTAYKQSDQCS